MYGSTIIDLVRWMILVQHNIEYAKVALPVFSQIEHQMRSTITFQQDIGWRAYGFLSV